MALTDVTDTFLTERFFHAISIDDEDGALRLLALGASPLATYQTSPSKKPTALEYAAECERYNANGPDAFRRLIPAMLEKLTQKEKDDLLATAVRSGNSPAVRALLDGGADPHRRALLLLAPSDAEDIRRMLRSSATTSNIEAAMGGDDGPAAPAKDMFTL